MQYDATIQSLIHPEEDQRVLFREGLSWNPDGLCAELSRLAYIRFETVDGGVERQRLKDALAAGGFTGVETWSDPRKDAQAFGARATDGTAYLVYRGTEPDRPQSILSDVDLRAAPGPAGGMVYQGFLEAEYALAEHVSPWIGSVGAVPLVISGHSLGAAMATLTAARHPRARLVTFGSPQVGDAQFASLFAGRDVRRYVDCCDIVTNLPSFDSIDHRHLDGERYIDRHGRVLARPPSFLARTREQLQARSEYLVRFHDLRYAPGRDFADHAPINYVSAVLGIREGP
jgi:pimeloyl-ACP methyl ester carboxylesterase